MWHVDLVCGECHIASKAAMDVVCNNLEVSQFAVAADHPCPVVALAATSVMTWLVCGRSSQMVRQAVVAVTVYDTIGVCVACLV